MTVHFHDRDLGHQGKVEMYRTEFAGNDLMARITSSERNDAPVEINIDHAVIDNSQYSYYLFASLGAPDIILYEVLIEFTYPVNYLPLIMRDY